MKCKQGLLFFFASLHTPTFAQYPPCVWREEGSVRGLKARGNFTVDFSWKNGRVISYHIYSPKARAVKIKMNGEMHTISRPRFNLFMIVH
jgi:hypothetical protein